jgi:tetratricopeptide (TPR) repeat protein
MWSGQLDRPDGPEALTAIEQVIYESFWQTAVDVEAYRAMRDHPDELDERDLLLVALSTALSAPTKANDLAKIALLERALALNPDGFLALERRARLHAELVMLGYSSDPAADLAIAEKAADRLLAINPNSLVALRAKATVLRTEGNWSDAEAVLRRVIGMQPTEANRRHELGQILMAEGRHREALESFEAAKQFAGGTDPVYAYDGDIAMAELALGRPDDAIVAARLSISEAPPDSGRLGEVAWLALIAAEGDGGRADLQKFLIAPRSWRSMAAVGNWGAHAANPKLLEGLRQSGMPEN